MPPSNNVMHPMLMHDPRGFTDGGWILLNPDTVAERLLQMMQATPNGARQIVLTNHQPITIFHNRFIDVLTALGYSVEIVEMNIDGR